MSFFSFLGDAIKPVTDLVDSLTTTDQEKLELRNELAKMNFTIAQQVLEYEGRITKMEADVIMAEAKGQSWLQRMWRPITMLVFLCLIVAHYIGWLNVEIHEKMWTLLQIGIGGYIASRGAEKILPEVVKTLKKQ